MPRRPKDILLPALLFVGNLTLLGPYLVAEFPLRGWSAEYTSIGLARLFQQQHFTWNPLWYGGIPFHYAGPPLLPLVLIAAWRALEDFRFFNYSVASFAAALLPLTSQSGTLALTMGLGAVLVAQDRIVGMGRTPDYRTAIKRTLAIWVTAHTLGAFWLTAGSFATRASIAYVEHLAERVLLSEMSLFAVGAVAAAGVLLSLAMWSRTPPIVAFLLAWIALTGASGLVFLQAGNDSFSKP